MFNARANGFKVKSSLEPPHFIFWDLDNVRPSIPTQSLIHDAVHALHKISEHTLAAPLSLSHAHVVANTSTWNCQPWSTNSTTHSSNISIHKTSQSRSQSADVELTRLIMEQLDILKEENQDRTLHTNFQLSDTVFTLVTQDSDFVDLMAFLSSKVTTISMMLHNSPQDIKKISSSRKKKRSTLPVRNSKVRLDRQRLAYVAHHAASFTLHSHAGDSNDNNMRFTPFVLYESWSNPKYLNV